MGIEDAFGVVISSSRCSKWKQARPVPPITPNRQASFSNETERIAQRMDGFDARENGHQAKSITVEIELPTIEVRPKGNARAHKPCFKAGIAKTTFSIKNWFV